MAACAVLVGILFLWNHLLCLCKTHATQRRIRAGRARGSVDLKSYYNSGPVFLGLRLHYSLYSPFCINLMPMHASAFWSSGGTASLRTRSPSLPFPSLCYALEDRRISRNAIALTLDIGLALHTNQPPGLFF